MCPNVDVQWSILMWDIWTLELMHVFAKIHIFCVTLYKLHFHFVSFCFSPLFFVHPHFFPRPFILGAFNVLAQYRSLCIFAWKNENWKIKALIEVISMFHFQVVLTSWPERIFTFDFENEFIASSGL